MRLHKTVFALVTALGCARAGEDPGDADDASLADATADSRDFDSGPEPTEDAAAKDTPPPPDTSPEPPSDTPPDAPPDTPPEPPSDTPMDTPMDTPAPIDSFVLVDTFVPVDTPRVEVGACSAGLTDCAGVCVDTRTRTDHCGACGRACAELERCIVGVCTSTSTCAAPRQTCSGLCVDVNTSRVHCGGCGRACASGAMCSAGVCVQPMPPGCASGSSDCDANPMNGCELMHGAAMNSCAAPMDLGAFCGDTSCGTFCPGTSWRTVSSQSDRRSRWFRARATECSNCPASVTARITLSVPAGIDYDLFVYRPCGAQVGRSIAGVGATDQVSLSESDSLASNDSFDYFIEVRYVSGASCANFTLTLEARANSDSRC